jgi:hypothetical protein
VNPKALAVGFYEGFTGIVTAPAKGAVKDGGLGFAKGFVTGTLGVLFKPGAGKSLSQFLRCPISFTYQYCHISPSFLITVIPVPANIPKQQC